MTLEDNRLKKIQHLVVESEDQMENERLLAASRGPFYRLRMQLHKFWKPGKSTQYFGRTFQPC
jgi:hypothetical protein